MNKNFNRVVASALSALTITGVGAVNNGFAAVAASNQSVSKNSSVDSKGNDVYKATKTDKVSNSLGDKAANVMAKIKRFVARHKLSSGVTVGAVVAALVIFSVLCKYPGLRPWNWGSSTPNVDSPAHPSDDTDSDLLPQSVNDIDFLVAGPELVSAICESEELIGQLSAKKKSDLRSRVMVLAGGGHLSNENARAYVCKLK